MQPGETDAASENVSLTDGPSAGQDPTDQLLAFSLFIAIGVFGNSAVLYIFTAFIHVSHVRLIALAMAGVDLAQCMLVIPANMALLALRPGSAPPSSALCQAVFSCQRSVTRGQAPGVRHQGAGHQGSGHPPWVDREGGREVGR